jgi:hypothetical protein
VVGKSSISFTVGGREITLAREEVEKALKDVKPELVRTHLVFVGGKAYPVKQALREATGLDTLDFHTTDARRVFRRLGFEVARKEQGS